MTSAPLSASTCVVILPATSRERSRTRTPSSGHSAVGLYSINSLLVEQYMPWIANAGTAFMLRIEFGREIIKWHV